jgi:hypothetical protein
MQQPFAAEGVQQAAACPTWTHRGSKRRADPGFGRQELNNTIETTTMRLILKSHYHAALAMLGEAIERCSFPGNPVRPLSWLGALHAMNRR